MEPYNSPIIDGNIGADWEPDELRIEDAGDSPWGGNDLEELWLTWDAHYLYIGIRYTISGNGVVCYIDCGDGGTGSFRTEDGWTGAWPRDVVSTRGINIFMGAWDGAPFDVYRADATTSTAITGECITATGGAFDSEIAIPWTTIYPDGFPVGAQFAIAVLLVGGDGYFAADGMPDQPTVGEGERPSVMQVFLNVQVDTDSIGIPDFAGTYIGGTVSFADADSPSFPIATARAGDNIATSSPLNGSWMLAGYSVGEMIPEIEFTAGGYHNAYLHDVEVTEPPNDELFVLLEPHSGAIAGVVVPAMQCSIRAGYSNNADPSSYEVITTSNAGGEFIIPKLAPGFWDVRAFPSSPDYSQTTVESVLVALDTAEIVIALEAATVLRRWSDPQGDDYGPGSYTYPTDAVFVEGSFDILEVVVKDYPESGFIEFDIEMGQLPPAEVVNWAPRFPPLNTQKIDIYIDAQAGGSSQGLPNRFANFVPTDYWDWAISVDGWWVGMFASNGQSIFDGYTQNVRDVTVSADTVSNIITVRVNKSALVNHLGPANFDEFDYWDFIVISMSHDGDGLDGVRWVNPGSPSQWNFGGGADGNINPNIIDMSVSAGLDRTTGLPKEPADPQEIQLDWNIRTPVELSAHRPIDITPPRIEFDVGQQLVHLKHTLHLAIRATITDDIAVDRAFLHFKTGAVWDSVEMGAIEDGRTFFGDIPVQFPISPSSPLATSLELYFTAIDQSGNFAILPDDGEIPPRYPFSVDSDNPTRVIPAPETVDSFVAVFDAGFAGDIIEFDIPSGDLLAFAVADLPNFPAIPATLVVKYPEFAGNQGALAELSAVRREINISGADESLPITLRLHWLSERLGQWEAERLSLTEFGGNIPIPRPYGGTHYQKASTIIGDVRLGSGFWAVGRDIRGLDDAGVLRNIRFSPNPFSPNGDGIYDEVEISWETRANGSIDIDVYDLNGRHIRRLARNMMVYDGRKGNIWWDGKSEFGDIAKAGIYAVRFELTFIDAGVELKVRENRPVVIIK
ncbi:MAG TPA: hypothetical protein ENN07_04250 [candidate division Zixibacteria bacterium]|nr:hypothetical protein [candidate division Zixibacteria bacterium]